jgi:hypothetical protein
MIFYLDFIFDIIARAILIPIGIILSPLLYLTRYKDDKIWNRFQDLPYNVKLLKSIYGNDEDGVYFDPNVLKHKPNLLKNSQRGKFMDFFKWAIIRNPLHNFELYRGIDTDKILDLKVEKGKKGNMLYENYTAYLKDGRKVRFVWRKWRLGRKYLTFYYGPRLCDLVPLEEFKRSSRIIYNKFYDEQIKNYKGKYIQNRGYFRIRNSNAFRLKTVRN